MEYTRLGDSGLSVSRLGLGCLAFGSGMDWMLDREESQEIVDAAIDLGVTFFDTANAYSGGESEAILGQTISGHDRDRLVLSTKLYFPTRDPADDPNAMGLSRKAIERELAGSLDRLGVEAIDLYQTHRWDYETPIEETMRALDDAVRRGQVRYLGASSMWAHQLASALYTSERLGLDRFVSMQNHYNLVYREEEREMLRLCAEEGIGVTPWSPLARGYLARPHRELEATSRGRTDVRLDSRIAGYRAGGGDEINERIEELAEEKGVSIAQLALAWVLHQDVVDAPIVGASSVEHLEEAVEAIEIDLSDSDLEYLEEPYQPVAVIGHR